MVSCSAARIVDFASRTFLTVKQFDLDGSPAPVSLINYQAEYWQRDTLVCNIINTCFESG